MDWSPGRGSEQSGLRPALIVSSNSASQNPNYPNVIVATLSTKGRDIPIHVKVDASQANGLAETSYVKCEQVMTISKERLQRHIGSLYSGTMSRVDEALKLALGLRP